jgi:hypothetical protein
MSLFYSHSKLVIFTLKNANSSEVRIAQSDMKMRECHGVDVIVLFRISIIALKTLNNMSKLLIPCFEIPNL